MLEISDQPKAKVPAKTKTVTIKFASPGVTPASAQRKTQETVSTTTPKTLKVRADLQAGKRVVAKEKTENDPRPNSPGQEKEELEAATVQLLPAESRPPTVRSYARTF